MSRYKALRLSDVKGLGLKLWIIMPDGSRVDASAWWEAMSICMGLLPEGSHARNEG